MPPLRYVLVLMTALPSGMVGANDAVDLDTSYAVRAETTAFANEVTGLDEPSSAVIGSARANIQFDAFGGTHRVVLEGRHIFEETKSIRSGASINEAYWFAEFDSFDVTVGKVKENWGVLESRDLVNTINTVDGLARYNSSETLPQDLIKVGIPFSRSRVDLYVLGEFEPTQFQRAPTRFLPVRVIDNPALSAKASSNRPDFALRIGFYDNDYDLTYSYFDGTNRVPRIIELNGENRPFYNRIRQHGIEALWIDDQMIYKFEGVAVDGDGGDDSFYAATIGAEYTLTRVTGKVDATLNAEYHWDRSGQNAPNFSLNNYLSVGSFFSFNDTYLSTLRLSASAPVDDIDQHFLTLELDWGITDNLRLDLAVNHAGSASKTLSGFPGDDPLRLVELALEYSF